jgi:hypothetical protein
MNGRNGRLNRDDFSIGVISVLAHRAGFRCSKPDCRALTVGPSSEGFDKRMCVGVAAHITAASPGGKRYDPALSPEQRASVTNGIWLCQTHAKEVDDDATRHTVGVLRAWKHHAEEDARALMGRPISSQSLDVALEVALHRAPDNSLLVTGVTNMPDGAKLWVGVMRSGETKSHGFVTAVVGNGMFGAAGYTDRGQPQPHGWYTVEVLAYFNGPWGQPDCVTSIVGMDGVFLAGRFANPLHPEIDCDEQNLLARFECVAPPLVEAPPRTEADVASAIQIVQQAVLTVEGSTAADPVGEIVAMFMSCPGLRERKGWSGRVLPNGLLCVEYSYWDGDEPTVATWSAVLEMREVRYTDRNAKSMSWSPDY